jgi:hypothetical protein
MFVLRTVGGPNKPQVNILLGNHYTISYSDSDGFNERLRDLRYPESTLCELYAIVESELHHPVALLDTDSNYIMLGEGQTFANVSNKK